MSQAKNNKKIEKKMIERSKRKGKLASGSIQQNSYTGGEVMEAPNVERIVQEPKTQTSQRYSATSNGRSQKQQTNNDRVNKIPIQTHYPENNAQSLGNPHITQQYFPINITTNQYFNGMSYMGTGIPSQNYMMLNSPILNAYHMNEQCPRKQIEEIQPRMLQEKKKHPFTRACTHLAIAYFIHFSKEKTPVIFKFFFF